MLERCCEARSSIIFCVTPSGHDNGISAAAPDAVEALYRLVAPQMILTDLDGCVLHEGGPLPTVRFNGVHEQHDGCGEVEDDQRAHDGPYPCFAEHVRAIEINTSRNAGGVAFLIFVLSLPPTMAVMPMRRAFS